MINLQKEHKIKRDIIIMDGKVRWARKEVATFSQQRVWVGREAGEWGGGEWQGCPQNQQTAVSHHTMAGADKIGKAGGINLLRSNKLPPSLHPGPYFHFKLNIIQDVGLLHFFNSIFLYIFN
jgi:hypothetical protein